MSMEQSIDEPVPETKEQKNAKKRLNSHLRFARKNLHHKQKMQSKKKIKEQTIAETKKTVEKLRQVEAVIQNTNNIITPEVKELVQVEFQPIVKKKVGWEPFQGPQTEFLQADEFEVLLDRKSVV